MKIFAHISVMLISLAGCANRTPKGLNPVKGEEPGAPFRDPNGLSVQDTSMYDKSFLDGLMVYNKPLKLMNSFFYR